MSKTTKVIDRVIKLHNNPKAAHLYNLFCKKTKIKNELIQLKEYDPMLKPVSLGIFVHLLKIPPKTRFV